MTNREKVAFAVLTLAIAIGASIGIGMCMSMDKERIFAYDHLANAERWDAIVQDAIEHAPNDEMSLAYLNLALAKTGALADAMFQFPQRGTNGLIPPKQLDFTSPLAAAEIYYHMGIARNAERFAYEIQEAIPDFQKSGRMHKRLAEAYMLAGDYQAAQHVLNALRHTWAYRSWADNMMNLLADEQAIAQHPVYGKLRELDYKSDYFYRDEDADDMIGLLFLDNPSHKMAYEYLMAWALLERDLQSFLRYFQLDRGFEYDQLPLSYQEALMIAWTSQTNSISGMPWPISPSVASRIQAFLADLSARRSQEHMREKYGDTYWYYFMYPSAS